MWWARETAFSDEHRGKVTSRPTDGDKLHSSQNVLRHLPCWCHPPAEATAALTAIVFLLFQVKLIALLSLRLSLLIQSNLLKSSTTYLES